MPNYCCNDLHIDGSKEDIDALYKLIGADKSPPEFHFEAVLPAPEELKAESAQLNEKVVTTMPMSLMGDAEYVWRVNMWGTKWEPSNVEHRTESFEGLAFTTAWSPPIPVIAELHRLFPNVRFYLEYFEYGVGYCGGCTFEAEDFYRSMTNDEDWNPGTPTSEWVCNHYRGPRGG